VVVTRKGGREPGKSDGGEKDVKKKVMVRKVDKGREETKMKGGVRW
jgi:hypothetical protein